MSTEKREKESSGNRLQEARTSATHGSLFASFSVRVILNINKNGTSCNLPFMPSFLQQDRSITGHTCTVLPNDHSVTGEMFRNISFSFFALHEFLRYAKQRRPNFLDNERELVDDVRSGLRVVVGHVRLQG